MPENSYTTIKIMCHSYLPAGTILVSEDIYKILKEKYTVESLDKLFLEKLGIRVCP